MRSKQLNFFILPEDWVEINLFLYEAGASILSVPITSIDDLFNNMRRDDIESHQVYLTNQQPGKGIVLKPDRSGYYIDIVRSNVVQFTRGGFYPNSNKTLHRARFYTVLGYEEEVILSGSQ
jgi:hypothetical protein